MASGRWMGLALGVAWAALPAVAAPKVDFNRDIRPLLSDNCFACHGNDTTKIKGGVRLDTRDSAIGAAKSGKHAIVPGKTSESELMRRIVATDPDELMPPAESRKSLTPAQKEMLGRWIAEGAEYRGHWSYQPPVRPEAPAGPAGIDRLVGARLGTLGLKPSAEADRRTLARRLHADLTGLPPTAEEVDAFERDRSTDAYERLVERLLSSPHYGERMAQGWLDLVRFADTVGYHSDNPRNIWPYRDYVIRAFNANKRFDQFTREQLAGDLLPGAGIEQRVGSAFNRLLLTTEEGGAQPKDYESRYLTDRVRAVGAVWLGQTIGCSQCHDHKFDPITMRDFYSMGAFFADIEEAIIGRREDGMLVPDERQAAELGRRSAVADALKREYEGPHPELSAAFGEWERDLSAAVAGEARWTRMAPAAVSARSGATLKVKDDHSVLAGGKNPDAETYTVGLTNVVAGVVGVRVEALPDDSLPSKGPGRAGNGNFVLSEVVARVSRGDGQPRRLAWRSAKASFEQTILADKNPYHAWTAASAIDGDAKGPGPGWAVLPEIGKPQQLVLELSEPLTLGPGETLEIELQQLHGDGGHNLGRFRLSLATDPEAVRARTALPPPKEIGELLAVPAERRTAEQAGKLRAKFLETVPGLAGLRQRMAEANKARTEFEGTIARCLVTVRNQQPRVVRILPRGNWMVETGDVMEPALPAFLAGKRPEGRRLNRLDLAEWIVSRDNPLTARVVMNRLWRQFFGMGLSRVADDLGAQGEPPANQALLDWLACEFRDSGWDTKHMVRTIVLSRTYRQTSVAPRDVLARDPYNRELARQGRWRLDAELVRDQALALGGLLVPGVGGPSVKPYQPDGYWENLNFPQRSYDASPGADQYRRGLYTWWQRSFVHPSLLAFDAPTREECVADRNRSNIPQQALVLLNDPTYVEAARALATRVLRECRGDADARIAWAWRKVLARSPQPEEREALRALLDKHLAQFRNDREAAAGYIGIGRLAVPGDLDAAELAAWTDVARALLNLHETITRS
ncbi:MAG: DUF1553 domain-containing protein [Verrucomicrobia bacterium]|nr:MAG: DUF1553 domain-containing protein [Verrucomicrobiota bacterium]